MGTAQDCIEECLNCFAACEKCAAECISLNDPMYVKCIELCRDCADMCALVVRLENRDSSFSPLIRKICSDVCRTCADECNMHAMHHEHCKKCAEACMACAVACNYSDGL